MRLVERMVARWVVAALASVAIAAGPLAAQEDACTATPDPEQHGMLVGRVLDSRSSAAVAGAVVTVYWRATSLGTTGIEVAAIQRIVRADSLGRFRACGLPHGVALFAWAEIGEARSLPVELTLPELDSAMFEFRTPAGAGARSGVAPAANARLRGVVRAPNGAPVPGARVRLALGGGEVRTDSSGRFDLPVVGPGPAQLDVIALGWTPAREWVPLPGSGAADVTVTLATPVRVLDEQRIVATSAFAREFEDRRRRGGGGYFMDQERIAQLGSTSLHDLARTFPSLQVSQSTGMHRVLETRRRGNGCPITVFLDGSPVDQMQLEAMVVPEELFGIEYYPGFASPPIQYTAFTRSQCGTMLLWTRSFAAAKKGTR